MIENSGLDKTQAGNRKKMPKEGLFFGWLSDGDGVVTV